MLKYTLIEHSLATHNSECCIRVYRLCPIAPLENIKITLLLLSFIDGLYI